jgi:nitroreductase
MSLIESLKWRSAIQKFDPSKKVNAENLETLLEAGRLSPTSGGFQPFKIVVVSNEELKKKMIPVSYGQEKVAECSHLLVFAIETEINDGTVDRYIELAAEVRGQDKETLNGYSESMKNFVGSMDDAFKYTWARSQAYIALGMVMAMAAEMKIDSGPMEGFDPLKYQEMLDLKSKNLMPVVVLPIGYRSDEEYLANLPKVRKSRENFILEIN